MNCVIHFTIMKIKSQALTRGLEEDGHYNLLPQEEQVAELGGFIIPHDGHTAHCTCSIEPSS